MLFHVLALLGFSFPSGYAIPYTCCIMISFQGGMLFHVLALLGFTFLVAMLFHILALL